MKRILSIVMLISILILGFQNCSGVTQLPVSLGGNSLSVFSTTNINFPYSWSTDTGNFDNKNRSTPRTAIIDLADNVCFLYSQQLSISKEECSKIIRFEPRFINLFHNLNKPYKSYEELEFDSNNGLIEFNKLRGDACLLYIDSHQIQIKFNETDKLSLEDSFAESAGQIYSVIASSADCANIIHQTPISEDQ